MESLPYVNKQLLAFDERDVVHELIAAADWSDRNILEQSAGAVPEPVVGGPP